LNAALVFVTARDGRWVETGFSDGKVRTDVLERLPDAGDETADAEIATQLARAGTWIAPPGRAFDGMVDRYRGQLGVGNVWLLPVIRERKWVGGALFNASADVVAARRAEAVQIEALSAAVGLAIAQAQARGEALAMSDELAQINRRWAATQAELVRARALHTVVAMAAGAAHELNNPLAVISGRAQMLRGRVADDETKRLLDMIALQAQACSDIVTELMEFANPRAPKPESIDLREFFDSLVIELADAGLLDASCLAIKMPSDRLLVRFDREQFGGVFRELIRNSIDATEPFSRRLTVKVASDLAEESIVIELSDNGRGMTTEVLASAMDPFFSHRPAGRGRGLGLARVQRWLQQNGGAMRIRSRPGEGTTAELCVPAMGQKPA
jgi:signal transduction histidine kinase